MVRRICGTAALLVVVWCGLAWAQEGWIADVCFTTNFALDRLHLTVQPLVDEVPEGTKFEVSGVWYLPGLYTILLSGTAVYSSTYTFWWDTSLTGANGSEFFGGNQNFSVITHGNTWRIQASGTPTPFQVQGTLTSATSNLGCNPPPWGRVPPAAIPVPFHTADQAMSLNSERALGSSPSDAAGHYSNNEYEK